MSFIHRHKYGAKKLKHAGFSFASKLEAALYDHLRLLELAGELSEIQVQDHVYLTDARICYIPDFKAFDKKLSEFVWYEAKGLELGTWKLKKKLWKHYGPGRLRIFKGSAKRLIATEEIIPRCEIQKSFAEKEVEGRK